MAEQDFSPDCQKCFGLCCVALSFERGPHFAHDKLAGQPCQYLQPDFRCAIHAQRENLGYDGCEAFDCLGAGQRASALHAADNWRRDPQQARLLYASFSQLLRIQEMRQALTTAQALELSPDLHAQRQNLLAQLDHAANATQPKALDQAAPILENAKTFLKNLGKYINQK